MRFHQGAQQLGPLDEASQHQEMPAAVAVHRAFRNSPEGANAVLRAGEEVARLGGPDGRDFHVAEAKMGNVQARPHVAAYHVANLARVLAGGGHAVADGVRVVARECQIVGECVGVRRHEVLLVAGRFHVAAHRGASGGQVQPPPTVRDLLDRPVLHVCELVAKQPASMPRPLQVAPHPVQTAGVAREHAELLREHPEVLAAAALARIHDQ